MCNNHIICQSHAVFIVGFAADTHAEMMSIVGVSGNGVHRRMGTASDLESDPPSAPTQGAGLAGESLVGSPDWVGRFFHSPPAMSLVPSLLPPPLPPSPAAVLSSWSWPVSLCVCSSCPQGPLPPSPGAPHSSCCSPEQPCS